MTESIVRRREFMEGKISGPEEDINTLPVEKDLAEEMLDQLLSGAPGDLVQRISGLTPEQARIALLFIFGNRDFYVALSIAETF